MLVNALSNNNAGPQRISFVHASSLLVAQALTDANARMARHFPGLGWPTWGDVLRELQLDLLVHGKVVSFDWQDLARRVQALAAYPELPVAIPLTDGQTAAALVAELNTYHRQAVPALAEVQASAQACGPLAYALLTQLAHRHARAARGDDAIQDATPPPVHALCPPSPKPLVPLTGPAEGTSGLLDESREAPGLVSPVSRLLKKKSLPVRRNASKRRTFRDIVEHHPRGDGKFGFSVREICTTMHISAASLTHARTNPGHLMVQKIVALAGVMGEHPLHVLGDLLTEAAGKKRRKRKNE